MNGEPVVLVDGLRKRYGDVTAVDGISFEVGAGRSSAWSAPTARARRRRWSASKGCGGRMAGRCGCWGWTRWRSAWQWRSAWGCSCRNRRCPRGCAWREALALFGAFYQRRADPGELLARLGLADKANAACGKLSGGQKQRLFIALALVNRPEVVFFDELTTGLDPQARRATWDLVRQVRDGGCTVVLTTHSMEEAERLCDRVLIMDHGRIVALDTPEALIRSLGAEKRLVFTLPPGQAPPASLADLPQVRRVEQADGRLTVYGQGDRFVSSVVYALEEAGVPFLDLRTVQPSLEDVFLALTGREMRE